MPELIHLKGQEVIAPSFITTESTFSETFSSVVYTVPAGKRALVKPRHPVTTTTIVGLHISSRFNKPNSAGEVGMTAALKLGDSEVSARSSYASGSSVGSFINKSAYFYGAADNNFQRNVFKTYPSFAIFVDPPILLEGETVEVSVTRFATDHTTGSATFLDIQVNYDLIIIEEDNV